MPPTRASPSGWTSCPTRHGGLREAETTVRLLAAYRWFAYRLPELFVDLELADMHLAPWISVVDGHLRSRYRQGVGGGRGRTELVLAGAALIARGRGDHRVKRFTSPPQLAATRAYSSGVSMRAWAASTLFISRRI
jgi:hypothetical protein